MVLLQLVLQYTSATVLGFGDSRICPRGCFRRASAHHPYTSGTSLVRRRFEVSIQKSMSLKYGARPERPWFRGRLVFKAHRLLYHSTLCLKVIKQKEREESGTSLVWRRFGGKAHRLLYHSTLGLRVIKKKKKFWG